MSKKRNYYTSSKKSKIAIAVIERKLTQAQLTSEYGFHPTQRKGWKQAALQAITDVFSNANAKEMDKTADAELVASLYEEIGRLQAQLSWLKKVCA